ncbi:MAG: potassium channel protein [Nitrospira sp.]|nr:potassium channel protein [Nitrospira sp.]
MKFIPSQLVYFLKGSGTKRNIKLLCKFFVILLLMVTLYSTLFHFIMEYEGRKFSWLSGLYWTFVTMTTLGFGDITFTSDLGKVFSVFVLLSGVIFLLVMLPFTFISFFYAPWLEAKEKARAPRELAAGTRRHVVLTNTDPISLSLVQKLTQYNYNYAIVVSDLQRVLELHDMNYKVVMGDLDDPDTYRKLYIGNAALVVINNNDMLNTNITFTIRSLSKDVPIVTTADAEDSLDILKLAGASYVFHFAKMLGSALARRSLGSNLKANLIGRFGELLIAEAPAMRTILEGQTLRETRLRDKTGITVVGMWERGKFEIPLPDSRISPTSVLVLAGSEEHLSNYDRIVGASYTFTSHVVILGGGRVGFATAEALKERGIACRIVESDRVLAEKNENYIFGSAADINTLHRAGIKEAPSIFITTHDDDLNIYLTIYCRRLRPDIQIISRATLERNISKLHEAGADIVMSYASLAINTIINILKPNEVLMLTEGLNVFRVHLPTILIGKSLQETGLRERTGCSVVAIHSGGTMKISPDPYIPLAGDSELILIGTVDAEKNFLKEFLMNR